MSAFFRDPLLRVEGLAVLQDADVGLARVQFDFVAVVVIEFGGAVVGILLPGYVDSLAVGEIVAVLGVVVALERQITLVVSGLIMSVLDQDVLEGQLLAGGGVHVGLVPALHPLEAIVQAVLFVVLEVGLRDLIRARQIDFGGGDGIFGLPQRIGIAFGSELEVIALVVFRVGSGVIQRVDGL